MIYKINPFLAVICWILLILNTVVITKYILFKKPVTSFTELKQALNGNRARKANYKTKNLELFATIRRISHSRLSNRYKYENIGGNILGFVPLGFLLPLVLFRRGGAWKTVFSVFLLSLFFETVQLKTGLGVFDVDDLLLNTVGGITGFLLLQLLLFFISVRGAGRNERKTELSGPDSVRCMVVAAD